VDAEYKAVDAGLYPLVRNESWQAATTTEHSTKRAAKLIDPRTTGVVQNAVAEPDRLAVHQLIHASR
jgi:hypothetical protein